MRRFVLRRLLQLVPVLLIVSFGTLVLIELTPGDPARAMLGPDAPAEQVEAVRERMGLNDSIPERYVSWVADVARFDFGDSLQTQQPVLDAIKERLPVTLEIALLAQLLALLIAIPLGVYTAYRADGIVDRISGIGLSFMISAPAYLAGLVFAYFFAVELGIFPVLGWVRLTEDPWENLRHAFLPAATMALTEIAVFARLLRSDMIATLQNDFVLAAKAKGSSPSYILWRHALRPSSFSLLTVAALSTGRLLGGTVLVEQIFSLPGIGSLVLESINAKDLAMVQGVVMFVAVVYVLINLAVDIVYAWLDPRIRAEMT